MKKHLQLRRYGLTIIILLVTVSGIMSQNYTEGILDGVIRVKLKPGTVAEPKGLAISYEKKIALTGVESIDKLNSQFTAKSIKRIFPYSAKHEAKHQKHGLHLWYEIEFDDSAIQTMAAGGQSASIPIAKAYASVSEIEIAEEVHEIKLVEPYSIRKSKLNNELENTATTSSSYDFNDPLLTSQWHYNNIGQAGGTPGEDINLLDAWAIETGNTNVIVSIHDEGMDVNHEDLAGAMWINEAELNGEDGVDDDGNGYIDDIYGYNFSDDRGQITPGYHGSHVGGIVGAVSNNGKGVAGVAGGSGSEDGVRLMSCMIIGGSSVNLIPNSFIYAADNGAVISQNSWGYNQPDIYEQVIHDAIDYFIEEAGDYEGSPMKGGIVIFAAGNDNSELLYYPGAYEPCFTVAALDGFSHKASFSNYGSWVDIAAPGGDEIDNVPEDTLKASILSCYPYNEYGYMDGTSQACPHVSGIAALVVSKYGGQDFTNTRLESHLRTGISDHIYDLSENASYIGKLGVGLTDAAKALDYDYQLSPNRVTDLEVAGVAQDLINLQWTVPTDEDDGEPYFFEVFYDTENITDSRLDDIKSHKVRNELFAGETFQFDLPNLSSTTQYYVLVRAIDRWDNTSALSNQVDATTTEGPIAMLDALKDTFKISIDVTQDTADYDSIQLFNHGEGILRWEAVSRHINAEPLGILPEINYPEIVTNVNTYPKGIKSYNWVPEVQVTSIQKENNEEYDYIMENNYQLMVIGETDLSFPNSAATKFHVNNPEGFNLTHIEMFMNHELDNGPLIAEIYSGVEIETATLLWAQEIHEDASGGKFIFVELDYHLFFEEGSTFWVVYHAPPGNLYPFVAGVEAELEYSDNCYYSLNLGKTWSRNEDVGIDKQYVWYVYAMSRYHNVGEYLVLSPESGEVTSNDSIQIVGAVNAKDMINGNYQGVITFSVNQSDNPILKLPVDINVQGQVPEIKSLNRLDYASVMLGADKTLSIEVRNEGLGRFVTESISVDNAQFEYISGHGQNLEAGTLQTLTFKYTPSTLGNAVANVTLVEADGRDYTFQLFGVGIEPPVAYLEPEADTFNVSNGYSLNIGDTVEGSFTLHNTGNYPLDYFMPAFADGSNMEKVPTGVHKFGYITRIDSMGIEPAYVWEDISETGTDVTEELIGGFDHTFTETEIGFEFPFFGTKESLVKISRYGLVAFGDEGVLWQQIPMYYDNPYNPDRYISAIGKRMWYDVANTGKVLYQRFQDKFIVQYDSVPYEDNYFPDQYFTFQIVLHDNGNINMYYKQVEVNYEAWGGRDPLSWFTFIGIGDQTQDDAIVVHEQRYPGFTYREGSAIEFINPGYGLYTDLSHTYGTIMPGSSVIIDYKIPTDSLYVAEYTETLPIITNDPVNNPLLFSANFEIIGGGSEALIINEDTIDFKEVFQFDSLAYELVVSNIGKATDSILIATFDKGNFNLHGASIPEVLKPGRKLIYQVVPVTNALGSIDDTLRFLSKKGNELKVTLDATITSGPEILVNPTSLSRSVRSLEKQYRTFTVENTGDADLSFNPVGNDWMKIYEYNATPEDTVDVNYHWETSLDGNSIYNYMDIVETGTKLEGLTGWRGEQWSEAIELPFTFNFYGVDYDSIYVGYSGLVSFTPAQEDHDFIFGQTYIPETGIPSNFLAPLWIAGGISNPNYYPETGQYILIEDERVIVHFQEYNSGFAMGEPISYQVVLYPNGNIKFQYKMPDIGQNYVTGMGVIGIENYDGTKGEMVSFFNQTVNYDMSITFYPYQEYLIAKGASKEFEVELDALELYDGVYEDEIVTNNNDPLNKDLVIPVTLTVVGTAEIEVPGDIIFGDMMILETEEHPFFEEYIREFEISNPGTAPFAIAQFTQHLPDDIIVEAAFETQAGDDLWITEWYRIFPKDSWDPDLTPMWIQPGTSQQFRARIIPETAADLNDTLGLVTSLGSFNIPIVAASFLPPVLTIDNSPIEIYAQLVDHKETRTITVDNSSGGYPLIYDLLIEFERQESQSISSYSSLSTTGSIELQARDFSKENLSKVSAYSLDNYNRRLANDTNTYPDGVLGYNGGYPFYTATRFVAPEDGFNLTHVQTWFVPSDNLVSEIQVKVFGGSDNIFECQLLYEGTHTHTITEEDKTGELLSVPLDQGHLIYPGEYFFVVFGYPIEIGYPQGYVEGLEPETNKYMFGPGDGNWYDLTSAGFEDAGWFVRAIEESYVRSVWAEVISSLTDTIPPGQSKEIELDFDAVYANPGINEAILNISTNDSYLLNENIDLILHRNQGPQFIMPQSSFRMAELDTLVFTVEGEDVEGDLYTITLSEGQGIATGEYSEGNITITCTPGYSDQGMKYLLLTGEDQFGNISEKTIAVEVINVNRAPMANTLGTVWINRLEEDFYSLKEESMFTDPDNDMLAVSVDADTNGVVTVYEANNNFLLEPVKLGETILKFTATDEYGASAENFVSVVVSDEYSSITAERKLKLSIYPNPTSGKTFVTLPDELGGELTVSIINSIGQLVYQDKTLDLDQLLELDLEGLTSGVYEVRLSNAERSYQEKLIIQ